LHQLEIEKDEKLCELKPFTVTKHIAIYSTDSKEECDSLKEEYGECLIFTNSVSRQLTDDTDTIDGIKSFYHAITTGKTNQGNVKLEMHEKSCFCNVCRDQRGRSSVSQYPTIPSACLNKLYIGKIKHVECKNRTDENTEVMNKLRNIMTAQSFFGHLIVKELNIVRKVLGISTKNIGGANKNNPTKGELISYFKKLAEEEGWNTLKERILSKMSSNMSMQD
jgi:hypothetical protein